jgi:hypothetical protein
MTNSATKVLKPICDTPYGDYDCRKSYTRGAMIWRPDATEIRIEPIETKRIKEFGDATNYIISLNNAPSYKQYYDIENIYHDWYALNRTAFVTFITKLIETFAEQSDKDINTLPFSLVYIQKAIEDAQELLTYKDNWDDEGALSTDVKTLENATSFLKNYAIHLYGKYAALISDPSINIMKDGSVYLFWETAKGKLLIVFTKEKSDTAYFYGESKAEQSNIPWKGGALLKKKTEDSLALWMKDYLLKT